MNETDLAWAAGLFDGEGCFHCSKPYLKHGKYYANISCRVGQKHPEVLFKFQRIVGVGKIRQDSRGMYRWEVQSFRGVFTVMNLLWPYLGSVKKRQGNNAVRQFREARLAREAENKTVARK